MSTQRLARMRLNASKAKGFGGDKAARPRNKGQHKQQRPRPTDDDLELLEDLFRSSTHPEMNPRTSSALKSLHQSMSSTPQHPSAVPKPTGVTLTTSTNDSESASDWIYSRLGNSSVAQGIFAIEQAERNISTSPVEDANTALPLSARGTGSGSTTASTPTSGESGASSSHGFATNVFASAKEVEVLSGNDDIMPPMQYGDREMGPEEEDKFHQAVADAFEGLLSGELDPAVAAAMVASSRDQLPEWDVEGAQELDSILEMLAAGNGSTSEDEDEHPAAAAGAVPTGTQHEEPLMVVAEHEIIAETSTQSSGTVPTANPKHEAHPAVTDDDTPVLPTAQKASTAERSFVPGDGRSTGGYATAADATDREAVVQHVSAAAGYTLDDMKAAEAQTAAKTAATDAEDAGFSRGADGSNCSTSGSDSGKGRGSSAAAAPSSTSRLLQADTSSNSSKDGDEDARLEHLRQKVASREVELAHIANRLLTTTLGVGYLSAEDRRRFMGVAQDLLALVADPIDSDSGTSNSQ